MSLLMLALALALGGPGDLRERETTNRCRLNLLAEPLDDLERRLGTIPIDEPPADAEDPEKEKQDENRKDRPEVPLKDLAQAEPGMVDFEWLELQPRIGIAFFSKDYHVNPSLAFGVGARAPLTWLSPSSNPGGEYFGIFAQIDLAFIKRTIVPVLDKPSGPIFMMTLGLDYTIYRNESWLLMVEGGIQYCFYGGITDLQNGYAPLVGLKAGFSLSRSVSLSFNPEVILGQNSDMIIFGWVAATVEF